MVEATENDPAKAPTPEADLEAAFALSVREAVERLSRISEVERASNTAIERAARAALQFLRAAAEAHGLARMKKKEDEKNADSGDARTLTPADFRQALRELGEDHSDERPGPLESGAGARADKSATCGGDRL